MPKTSSLTKLIEEAIALLAAQGIVVRRDRSIRTGGYCILKDTRYVVISVFLPPETALELLVEALVYYNCAVDSCSAALMERLSRFRMNGISPEQSNGQQLQSLRRASPKTSLHSA